MPKRREREAKLNETDDDSSDGSGELCKVRKEEQRSAANRRERTRMRVLSKAFGKLKMTLPWVPLDTKLSKLDTLRLASSYIGHLNRMLISGEDTISSVNFCPENLTWPLLFDSRTMEDGIRRGQCCQGSGGAQST